MSSKVQHVSLRVADIKRSAAFYEQVFGAQARTVPVRRSGPFVERLLSGPTGIQQSGTHILFPQGGGIELAELSFNDKVDPPEERAAWQRRILHFCIEVDDVRETAAKVEPAGGRLQFPVNDETGSPFVFVEDPDGHVIELIQMSFEDAIATVHRFVPGSRPLDTHN